MSTETTEYEDQAEHLKRLFNEVQQGEMKPEKVSDESDTAQEPTLKIDVLNLPPRKEVHGNHNNRARVKLGKPFLRFLSVIIILVALVIGAYFIWGEELIDIIKGLK